MISSEMKVERVDIKGDLGVVNAARVSMGKWHPEFNEMTDTSLISYLAENGHWTPFAHPHSSFRFKAPIFIARQLAKTQVGMVWNEVSRRYVDVTPEFYFPVPRRRAPNVKQGSMDEAVDRRYYCEEEMYFTTSRALQSYETLLQEGVAPEVARAVLPQNMMTEWIWTGSLYGFWRVVKLRADSHAQKESQEIAHMLLKLLREEYPVSIAALEKADGKDFGGNDGN